MRKTTSLCRKQTAHPPSPLRGRLLLPEPAHEARKPTRILFIGGCGRSGSTLLNRLIGNTPGFTSCGEVGKLWFAVDNGFSCTCGEQVPTCSFWGPIAQVTCPTAEQR